MSTIKCPKCQHENPPQESHCARCQTRLAAPQGEASQDKTRDSGGHGGAASGRSKGQEKAARNSGGAPAGDGSQASGQRLITFRKGQVVANRYTVLDLIGRGGMGVIYRVHDNVLNEEVALKTLLPQFVRDKMVVQRFYNEARIARQLAHPHVVRVHDIGMADKVLYISMEFLKGKSLRAILDSLPEGQRLPPATTLRIADELCQALEYAHRYTVHRDIKPENVMIGENGHVKLMDFGISKLVTSGNLTVTSVVMGTPHYMSPEQFRGSRHVDGRADIYSMGVLLYELLTGVIPAGTIKPVSQAAPEAPRELDRILAKCMEPEASDRYQSVQDLRSALRPVWLNMSAPPANAPGPIPEPVAKKKKSGGARAAVGGALVAAIILAAAYGLWQAETWRAAQPQFDGRPANTAAGARNANTFSEMQRLASQMMNAAAERNDWDAWAAGHFEEGEAHWDNALAADRAGDRGGALQAGWEALQYMGGPLIAPEGMVFIPPGPAILDAQVYTHLPGFFMDRTEVTVEDYLAFCRDAGWRIPPNTEPLPDDYPVRMVSFFDAQAYAAWRGARLPTEAEWVRAAYGGAPTAYPWGDEWEAGAANAATGVLAATGSHEDDVTVFGVLDMAGNVSEWTRTHNGPEEPSGPPTFGAQLLVRGGHYGQAAPLTARFTQRYEERRAYVGFRCVKPFPADLEALEAAL